MMVAPEASTAARCASLIGLANLIRRRLESLNASMLVSASSSALLVVTTPVHTSCCAPENDTRQLGSVAATADNGSAMAIARNSELRIEHLDECLTEAAEGPRRDAARTSVQPCGNTAPHRGAACQFLTG